MTQAATIGEAVEVIDRLSEEDREELLDLYKRRKIEAGRARITADIEQARRELAEGKAKVATPKEIVDEAFS
jgi:hypothetical protein